MVLSFDANMDYLQGQIRKRLRFRIQERETSRRLDRMMYGFFTVYLLLRLVSRHWNTDLFRRIDR